MPAAEKRFPAHSASRLSGTRRVAIPWPLPALLTWGGAWAVFGVLSALNLPLWAAASLGMLSGLVSALSGASPWRRLCMAAGFPLSLAASGLSVPPGAWFGFMGLLVLLYPLRAWRDAPFYPTASGALEGLREIAPDPARILDAGCGLGHGLRELRRIYPEARLSGMEWSLILRMLCALRCPFARVVRADIRTADWSGYDLVYIFQRPESMGPAADKARRELRPGAWLVSLEFEAPALSPTAVLRPRTGRPVWIYRMDETSGNAAEHPSVQKKKTRKAGKKRNV